MNQTADLIKLAAWYRTNAEIVFNASQKNGLKREADILYLCLLADITEAGDFHK